MDNEQKNFWQMFGDWLAAKQPHKEVSKQSSWLPTPGNIIFTLLALAIFAVFQQTWATPQAAVSTVNPTINYQGRLADSGGVPIDSNVAMSFAIFDAPSAGNLVWGPESHPTVPVADGLFNVGLGSLTGGGIPATVWQGGDRYLQITVAGETLSPREMIRSVPSAGIAEHALTSDVALTVSDGAITTEKLADGSVTVLKLDTTPWTNLTLASGFQTLAGWQAPQYRRVGDIVYLRGQVQKVSGNITNGTVIATLPEGFCPPKQAVFATESHGFATKHRLDIRVNCQVVIQVVAGDTALSSLDGIMFSLTP